MVKTPTQAQIHEILEPWRPQWLRHAAAKIWHANPEERVVWVRTHYDSDLELRRQHDALLASWTTIINGRDHFDRNENDTLESALRWLVLDDESVFNVGNWERMLAVLPELVGPFLGKCDFRSVFRARTGGSWQHIFDFARRDLHEKLQQIEGSQERRDYLERVGNMPQRVSIATAIIIVDQEAFARQQLKLVFVDHRGNIIRYALVNHDGGWFDVRRFLSGRELEDYPEWNNRNGEGQGGVGEAYRVDGAIGRDLYQVGDMLD